MRAALLAALLVSPTFAADAPAPPPSSPALALLVDTFGAPGVETLAARGVIVLQGKPGARRLAAVHWKALGSLAQAASSCLALTAAADALGREPQPAAPALDLAACRALPPDGLMTPSLHALAAALEAAHAERWALRLASAPPAASSRPNVFDTEWGRDLILRGHADALENPAPLVKPLFDDLLAGPRPDKKAASLLAAEAASRGILSPDVVITYDAAHGLLSEELRAQLRRTLSNERRRWAVAAARVAAADLMRKDSVKRELEDLRDAAKALSSRSNLPAALEAEASRGAAAAGAPKLKSAGIHLQEPTRLGQHELGDDVSVSGAYWVDGLKEDESVEIEETTALETERGFSAVETRTFKRRNGGPYPYSRTIRDEETRAFAVRSMVSAAGGTPIVERVEVPIAGDFELALVKESEAAGLRAACRLKDAEAAYQALVSLVADAAKVKPQYKLLAARAGKAGDASKAEADAAIRLEEALAAARADSAPQVCRYETGRVDEALRIAAKLPAGCDRDLPELHALRATITRRAADQRWFLKASAEARARSKACDLDAARARWSEAFAALEADPGARCGRVAEEESRAKTDFAELARKIAWREELGRSLAKAEAETAPARRLELLRPVTSRLGALNGACFSAEARSATALSEAAARSLTAPADAETARRLPPESGLVAAVADVRAERARRLDAAAAAEKASAGEPPAPPVAAPTKAAAAPAAPKAKAPPAKRRKAVKGAPVR